MARRFYQPRRRRMYAFGMSGSDWSRALAVAAFVGSYAALGLGRVPGFRVDRTGVAIIGATAMVVSGVIGWDEAVASVDAHTLVLLFGMMIVTAYLRLSGFFGLVMAWAIRNARTPLALLGVITADSGVLSAFFVSPRRVSDGLGGLPPAAPTRPPPRAAGRAARSSLPAHVEDGRGRLGDARRVPRRRADRDRRDRGRRRHAPHAAGEAAEGLP